MSYIEFKNVTKRYDDKIVVDNVDFNVSKGEIFGLLGPNGAGKSTLISMLCGIVPIDRGDIIIDNHSIINNPVAVKSQIGYIPQDLAIFENLSIIDNLKYFAGMYGLKRNIRKERINEALEIMGLKDRKKDKVKKLSGGMKRRLNIACAILHRPKVLIMDEPTVGIDPQSRNHILEFVLDINEKYNTTIVYTSHYMEEIQKLCKRLIILDQGKVIINGSKEDILRTVINESIISIELTKYSEKVVADLNKLDFINSISFNKTLNLVVNSNEYKLDKVINIIQQNGSGIINISTNNPDLETVFLNLTGKNLRD